MKQFLLTSMLLLCALIVGSSSVWATTYRLQQVTSVEAGCMYVFEQDGHVMSNTISSSALQTVSNYKTSELTGTETYVWVLEKATGGYYMKNVSKNKYLNNSSSTSVSFDSGKTSIWTFTFAEGVALIQNSSYENRFLGYGNPYEYKAYATSLLDNCPHAITVYKLVEDNDPSSEVAFVDKTPSIDYPGTTTYSQVPTTATGYMDETGAAISYEITANTAGATINASTGLVTVAHGGTVTVKATAAAIEGKFRSSSDSYTLTVNKEAQTLPYVESFKNSFGDFTSDGANYDEINIWYALSDCIRATSYISSKYRDAESWLTSPVIDATNVKHIALSFQHAIDQYFGTIADEAMVYAKKVGDTDWTKLSITYPKKPSSGYSDFLTTTVDLSDFAGKKLQIAFVYKGATTAAGIWKVKNLKISVSAEDITISAAGLATYVSDYDLDFTNVENLEAYYATQSGSTVELHQVNKIAAGTGVLLRAKNNATNFEVPVTTAAADATTGNIFVRGTGTAVATTTDGKYNWILSKKNEVVGFYHANGNTVAKNRAYLQTTVASARIDLNFEDVTAIDEVRDEMSDVRGGVYDLQGRKVQSSKLSKGLYIVNGKKVMVK